MKFEKTEVFNFQGAIRGMRNPKESWDKSDSRYICETPYTDGIFILGENDKDLEQRLVLAGNEHAKFMRQIFVSVDIIAPLYWWKEFDTYKIGTVTNSTSTMHKLASTPITIDCFEFDSVIEINGETNQPITEMVCNLLENYRQEYLRTKDKRVWKALIQLLPESWLQTKTVTLNYAVLRNIYFQRRNHKLTEWSEDFMKWINTLPYADELIKLEDK